MKSLLLLSFLMVGICGFGQMTSARTVRLGAVGDTVRTMRSILSDPQLVVVDEKGTVSKHYTVHKFTLVIYNQEGELNYQLEGNGNQLTVEHQRRIKSLPPQSQIWFEDIIGTCPDCRNFRLPNIRLIIQ